MSRLVQRAFQHVACKAAWTGRLTPTELAPFGDIGHAVAATRYAHRDAELARLQLTYPSPMSLYQALDAMDRALDEHAGGRPWLFEQVPQHCLTLWPLRNVMRLADQRGVLLRSMRFTDYEAEDSFVPELPAVCVDASIYGGGFDHDLFHHLFRTAPTEDTEAFESSMLFMEAVAQAYNSLVLASRHSGPAYDGHATWPGASLFGTLERDWGLETIPQQVFAYGLLGVVLHPAFSEDAEEVLLARLPRDARREGVRRLLDRSRRYVEADAGWLRGLRPRYDAPIMSAMREALDDRFYANIEALFNEVDDTLWSLEDIDLRERDVALRGEAAAARQDGRRLWLKAIELRHLTERGAHGTLYAALDTLCEGLKAFDRRQQRHLSACHRLATCAPTDLTSETLTLTQRQRALADERASWKKRLDVQIAAIRKAQASGELQGPLVSVAHADHPGELFRDVEFRMPIHVGSDEPRASE